MTPQDESKALRRAAEARLKKNLQEARARVGNAELPRLVHELQVHQIELEMQNEELRQARADTENLLSRYTELYDFAPVGYFTFDRHGIIHSVNLAGARLLAADRLALIGRHFADFITAEARPALAELLDKAFFSRQLETGELTLKDNETSHHRFVRIEVVAGGERLRAAVIDITATKRAEDALREVNESLEQRVREEIARNLAQEHLLAQQSRLAAMGEMIHNIAHQWRQPINALSLILGNIKEDYQYGTLTPEFLDSEVKIGQELIQGMSRTIDDFRDFFKPNKEKSAFLADNAVDDAINMVRQSFFTHSVEISRDTDDETCPVFGYPNEFGQVILNVLTNAKEAILARGEPGKVAIRIEKGTDTASVSIRDNGGGIPETVIAKIFDPYFTTKEVGTGIGLYMSKMIMDNMAGSIAVGNIDDGAEVILTIPLASPSAV